MKNSLAALTGIWLIGHGTLAIAASSVDLKVQGSITPSACIHTLSQDGAVDYGKLPAKDLNVDRITVLAPVTLKLNIECEAPALFTLNARDNRLGSSYLPLPNSYGLGLVNGDQQLGRYGVKVLNPVADSPVYPLISLDYGSSWIVNPSGSYLQHDALNAFGDSPTPKALQNVAVDLLVSTSIAPSKTLNLTGEVPLDGSATVELRYL